MRQYVAVAVLVTVGGFSVASAPPAVAEPGVFLVHGTSAVDSSAEKSATASCPRGTRVLGGGGSIGGGEHHVHLTRLQASGSTDTFVATATEVGSGYSGQWQVSATAVCGDEPAGLEYVSFQTVNDSVSGKQAIATCSAGKKLLSVGARVYGGAGEVLIDEIVGNAPALTSVSARAYEDEGGHGGEWRLWAYGVCADDVLGPVQFGVTGSGVDNDVVVTGAHCPAVQLAYGAGVSMIGAPGELLLRSLYVGGAGGVPTKSAINVQEDPTGVDDAWWATGYAICAP